MMPIVRSSESKMPQWCEVNQYEILRIPSGSIRTIVSRSPKEKFFVAEGRCVLRLTDREIEAAPKDILDVTERQGENIALEAISETVLVRVCGNWGEDIGGCGFFEVGRNDHRVDGGDVVDYRKDTNFDNHYHDCDEYWILYEGRGGVVTEGQHYDVGFGDCVVTGRGHHHDFPLVNENVKAVYFETTMEGKKRRGHLWNHTHGPAEPVPDRI